MPHDKGSGKGLGNSDLVTIRAYKGANRISPNVYSVGTSVLKIADSNPNRRTVTIANLGAAIVYVGLDGVTTTTGFPIQATTGQLTLELGEAELYAVSGSAGNDVRVIEEIDV